MPRNYLPTWRRRDRILLLERLELYISSGLPIDAALRTAGEGIGKRRGKSIDMIRSAVESGAPFARAFSNQISLPSAALGLIEHGEMSGNLSRAIGTARRLMEREDELLKKCLSALTYPIVIGIFACGLTIGLVRGVMPQIIPMLRSLYVQLPLLTRVVISLSEGFLAYGLYVLLGFFAAVTIFIIAYKKITHVRYICQWLLMKMPISGGLVRSYALTVFLQSFGALVEAEIPIDQAYARTLETIPLLPLRALLRSKIPDVKRGRPFHSALSDRSIPPYISPLVAAGEASGSLGNSVGRAAFILDRDIEHVLKRLTALIEPLMMAGMGSLVGAIALSIMMPVYDVSKALQH